MWRAFIVAVVACGAPAQQIAPENRVAPPRVEHDSDGDGIPDERDRCPREPEDFDVFQDDDGCPDPDNDGDGVPDATDLCPYDAGPNDGCPTPCTSSVIVNDDCILEPIVLYDAHDVPQAERIAEIVKLVHANPSVQALECLGLRTDLVAKPLRAQLPGIEIIETHQDRHIDRAVFVVVAKQRFAEGRFSAMDCTPFGAIFHPARPANCRR